MNGNQVEQNPEALGNAWFVDGIEYVDSPDLEMAALDTINPGLYAVSGSIFENILGTTTSPAPGDTIFETSYAPNRLKYTSRSSKENIAVFSEIYFPWGWTATVDGETVPIGRVDYVLRAIRVPAGNHQIEFTFDPQSLKATNALAITSVVLIGLICLFALGLWGKKLYGEISAKKTS